MARPIKVSADNLKLNPVILVASGEIAGSSDFVEYVSFEARGHRYQVAVQTNMYTVEDVFAFERKQSQLARNRGKNVIADYIASQKDKVNVSKDNTEAKSLLATLTKVEEMLCVLPDDSDAAMLELQANIEFLMIGAVVWNVPDIELSTQGLTQGDFRVISEAVDAIMSAINPTSASEKSATPSENAEKQSALNL